MNYPIQFISTKTPVWSELPVAKVSHFPWKTSEYRPVTIAQLAYTKEELFVRLESYEKEIRAIYEKLNDPVHTDSCMEFFFNPNPSQDDRYFNFEMNPIGTLHIGIGSNRKDRRHIDEVDPQIFQIQTSVTKENIKDYKGPSWVLEYKIPFEWIQKYYGEIDFQSGHCMKGNFYKCGDKTFHPHFGSWNKIENSKPDFHRPDFFGDLFYV